MLTSNMSWTKHIESKCATARKLLGLLYRRYYKHACEETLRQLYISIVRPHLEYAAPVWDPHLQKDCDILENVQKFACRMATKRWDLGYNELLHMLDLPSLSDRRLHLKMCQLYKIIHQLSHFPPDIVMPKCTRTHTNASSILHQPFAHTNSFFYSFIPHSISLWNALPNEIRLAPTLSSFKHNHKVYFL